LQKLVAVLVCRNNGTRLYGKPLQLIDVQAEIRILDLIINNLKKLSIIDEIVLGIAEGVENLIYKDIAASHGISYILGSEKIVSERYLLAAKHANADHVFRVTTECPFVWSEGLCDAYTRHLNEKYDATLIWNIVDGAEFEIYTIASIEKINQEASFDEKEHLSLYLRNNPSRFRINRIEPPKELIREDVRLTVDNPEDLIFCREIYKMLKEKNISMSLCNILKLLDENPNMINIIKPFLSNGHKMMRYWKD
jgi:spore coat polysaccharide biosynthesis protein SpsF